MSRKAILAILLVFAMGMVAFTGCAQQQQPAETETENGGDVIHIGVAMSTFDDLWLTYLRDGMINYAETLGGQVRLTIVDGRNDQSVQMGQVENFVVQGVDVIIVNPVDTETSGPLSDISKAAGIPMVAVNRPMANPEDIAALVASDSLIAGIMQMEALGELMGGEGNIVIMIGEPGHESARMRTEGVKQVVREKFPNIKIIAEQTARFQRALGLDLMENWIQAGLEIHGVAANNDEMAIGAIMALEQAGMLDDVFVAGIDASPDALQFMKEGKLDITVFQDANGQGAGAIEAAVKIARGETVNKEVWIPFQLVTPDKVDYFIAIWKQ